MIAFGLRLLLKSESEFSEGGERESVCMFVYQVCSNADVDSCVCSLVTEHLWT